MLRLGAGLSFSELIESPLCPPLLLEATRRIAAPGVRNLATLGGNICHASPAADSLPPLYLYDAVLVLASRGPRGPRYRRLPIGDFILGPRRTALRAGELLTAVELPRIPAFSRWTYEKVGARKAQAVSKVSFAAAAVLDQEGVIRDFRAAFGAVGPTVIRRRDLEESLRDRRPPGQGDIAGAYGSRLKPIDDQRSTAEYRRTVCLNLLNHFLEALGTGPFTGNHAILR
jgi:CO/xanthine dehydrogenase FAD-binding subunit